MNGQQCPPDENIVRAVRSSHWDSKKNRWSSDLFRGPDTSVSRLARLPLPEIFRIFFADLHKPPRHRVVKAGEINIGNLQALGRAHRQNGTVRQIAITVVPDPILHDKECVDNPAHALVKEQLPKTLVLNIIDNLKFHDAPNFWRRLSWYIKRLFFRIQ